MEGNFSFKDISGRASNRYIWKGIEIISILFLVRLLSFNDFGIGFLTMTILFFAISLMKPIYYGNKAEDVKRFYNSLSVAAPVRGFIISGILISAAILAGRGTLSEVLWLSALILLFSSFSISPESFYVSRNQQEKIYRAYMFSQAVAALVAIPLAIMGFGFKAILIGYVCFYIAAGMMLWSSFPFDISKKFEKSMTFEILSSMKKGFEYSLLPGLAGYGTLIIGVLMLGINEFPIIYLGFLLGFFLYENVTLFFNSVLIPRFIVLAQNEEAIRFNLVRVIEYNAFIIVPLSLIGIVMSKEIFYLLGFTWQGANESLIILLIAGLLKGLSENIRIGLIVKGKSDAINKIRLIEMAIVLMLALTLPRIFSVNGWALAILISCISSSALYTLVASIILGIDILSLSKDYIYIFFAGILSALALGLAKEFFREPISIALPFVGLLVYLGLTFVFNKELYRRFVRFAFSIIED